jgi:hypothetical protein
MAIERKNLEAHQLPAESMGIQHDLTVRNTDFTSHNGD